MGALGEIQTHWMNSNEHAIFDTEIPLSLDKIQRKDEFYGVQCHFSRPCWISSNEKKNKHVCMAVSVDWSNESWKYANF